MPAVLAFGIALGGGLWVGERFPFSRFSMYAGVAPRTQGAAPVFVVDGRIETIVSYDRFVGLDPDALVQPTGIPSTLDFRVLQMRSWVRGHGIHDGGCPSRAELGFLVFSQRTDGGLDQDLRVVSSGTACPR
jgi:hypothetical protein